MTGGELPVRRTNSIDGATMVWVPGGEFTMGLSNEEVTAIIHVNPSWREDWFSDCTPKHAIMLEGFWIYENPVTVAQYLSFCAATGHRIPQKPRWGWLDTHPIVRVSWADAWAYCQWAGTRLLTEAEWEKAARGTDSRLFPWGNEWSNSEYLHCSKQRGGDAGKTAPVGSYSSGASPYGVLDMEGNVGEWCADFYDINYYRISPSANPTGPTAGKSRVRRSGGWYDADRAYFILPRRFGLGPHAGYHDIGFRCAI